ncbi:ice-binding family protein [Streptomyces sp. G-G2]|uniref:ice-binding family protein n=1 Tax=Streptomyces sp. G-G2 TaxID=3046201 RepID=UPI0024B9D042|nr:ice-binding family protein [Streptomyces sp. G-G2]MDJ0382493.1 ice-binding family protein [Streptomyces sp. G-G2]
MTPNNYYVPQWRRTPALIASVLAAAVAAAVVAVTPTTAHAIGTPVPLGTAASFAILAGSTITNTGPSVVTGDIGVHPGSAITGFRPPASEPGTVNGVQHRADVVAQGAKDDLVAAYDQAAGQVVDGALSAGIANITLSPGVHHAAIGLGLTGDLTLDAAGDPNAVWVFQVPESLTTASASRVLLTNGASPCNVYWQIGASATLGSGSKFVGTIMALTSITVNDSVTIDGRTLARNGQVSLINDVINRGNCATGTSGGTTGGLVTGGAVAGTTTGGTGTGGTTTGGTGTGGTAGGLLGGVTTGGTSGGLLGGVLTGGVTGGLPGGLIAGTTGSTTGGANGGATGGIPGYPKPPKPPHDHEKPPRDHDHDHDHDHEKPPHDQDHEGGGGGYGQADEKAA